MTTNINIKFDETGTIGKVSKNAFLKDSPLSEEQYVQGDEHRHNVISAVANKLMDHASTKGPSSTGYSVSNVFLGGKVTGSVHISEDFKTVIEIKQHESELLAQAIARTEILWAEHNVSAPE